MTQEALRSSEKPVVGEFQQATASINEILMNIGLHGAVLIQRVRGQIYDSNLVRGIREEVREIKYDLKQIPGQPPIDD